MMIKLRNGIEEPEPVVRVTMMSLRRLLLEEPIAFYDLVMFVRTASPPFIGMAKLEEKALGLMQSGRVHETIRNVILSAVTGDGMAMSLNDPVAVETADQ